MSVFRSIVFAAAAAGVLVGLTVTVAQQVGTVPLILKAEVFEKQAELAEAAKVGAAVSTPGAATAPYAASHDHAAAGHDHAVAAWEPADGLERNAYTALFNVVEWVGFGLCLAGVMVIARRTVSWREGLLWGLGAFAAFVVAPGLGLPPELPGVPSADLVPRQIWWVGTAAATAAGLGMMAFWRSPVAVVAGLVLIAVPHIIGAPMLDHVDANVPDSLSRHFVAAVTVTTLISWVLLGCLTAGFLRYFSSRSASA